MAAGDQVGPLACQVGLLWPPGAGMQHFDTTVHPWPPERLVHIATLRSIAAERHFPPRFPHHHSCRTSTMSTSACSPSCVSVKSSLDTTSESVRLSEQLKSRCLTLACIEEDFVQLLPVSHQALAAWALGTASVPLHVCIEILQVRTLLCMDQLCFTFSRLRFRIAKSSSHALIGMLISRAQSCLQTC